MKYTEFVKENYDQVSHLPAKQRMTELGKMWKKSGHSTGVKKTVKKSVKKTGKKTLKKVKAGGIISDALGAFGLGVPKKRGRKGKGVVGGEVAGSGVLSDALGAFGLGMQKRKRTRTRGKGKGIVGGEVAGGEVAGSGILSGVLSSFGLGMPEKVKQKHFKRMVELQKKLHTGSKLTPSQHEKLKVYHTLHGQGFFDSLLSGIKKGVGAVASVVPKAISTIPQVLKIVPEAAKFVPAVGKLAGPLSKLAPLAALV